MCVALLCSWSLSGRIEGVREGTIIAALITGPFVRLIMPRLAFIRQWLSSETTHEVPSANGTEHFPWVITISREYGSGGHQAGEQLARQLGIAFYDKELITLAAQESHFSEEFISQNEQKLPSSLLYQMILQDYEAPLDKSLSYDDALFITQSRIIRRIASEKPCVIVGRCANYILKNRPNTISIFCMPTCLIRSAEPLPSMAYRQQKLRISLPQRINHEVITTSIIPVCNGEIPETTISHSTPVSSPLPR